MIKDLQLHTSYTNGEILADEASLIVNTGYGAIEIMESTFDGRTMIGNELRNIFSGGDILGS